MPLYYTQKLSLRALFGTDGQRNAVHGADSPDRAQREIDLIFGANVKELPLPDVSNETSTVSTQKTVTILKPSLIADGRYEEVLERIHNVGYEILKEEKMTITKDRAMELYKNLKENNEALFESSVDHLCSGPSVVLILKGDNVVAGWQEICGPEDPEEAKRNCPMSIRAIYGQSVPWNAIHTSSDLESAAREINILLPRLNSVRNVVSAAGGVSVAALERTIALIKPDVQGSKSEIISKIKAAGFTIIKEEESLWDKTKAEEFYKEHRSKRTVTFCFKSSRPTHTSLS